MVEKFNRTTEEHMLKVVNSHQRNWGEHLLLFLIAYKSAVDDIPNLTQTRIIFCKKLNLPCALVFETSNHERKEIHDYADQMQERLLEVYDLVRERINIASDRMKTRYDLRVNSTVFRESDSVWLYNPPKKIWYHRNWQSHGKKYNYQENMIRYTGSSPASKVRWR